MDGTPVDRIRESAPLGDGQPGQGGYGSAQFAGGDDAQIAQRRKRLLRSLDKPEFAGPAKAALALAVQCFTRAFAEAFGLTRHELEASLGAPRSGPSADPDEAANLIYRRAARALALGRARGVEDAGSALARAAEDSVTETFEALIDVGTLDGPGGVAVQVMLDAWAQKLARLADMLDE